MFLFIFESIGTSELLLVALVALIIFGPRKLPEMMRSFGKAMAEFRRSTNEFKESWEREVSLEDLAKMEPEKKTLPEGLPDNSIGGGTQPRTSEAAAPEIREVDPASIGTAFPGAVRPDTGFVETESADAATAEPAETAPAADLDPDSKQNWL